MLARTEVYQRDFDPRQYLKEYYLTVGPENRGLIDFSNKAARDIRPGSRILIAGSGPCPYEAFPLALVASEIHFSDYLEANLDEVRAWHRNDPNAHNWDPFIYESIHAEGGNPTAADVELRAALIRGKVTQFLPINVKKSNPLGRESRSKYDVVSMNFVAESITNSEDEWKDIMSNVCSLVRPGGTIITASLREAAFYTVAGHRFRATYLHESDIARSLSQNGFNEIFIKTINSEVIDLNDPNYHGYNGMMFAIGSQKK